MSPFELPVFDQSYMVTPGAGMDEDQYASLCPGDSGGPVYRRDGSNKNRLVGINAYYTFKDASGVSRTNLHTRLGNDALPYLVKPWLEQNLSGTSFLH